VPDAVIRRAPARRDRHHAWRLPGESECGGWGRVPDADACAPSTSSCKRLGPCRVEDHLNPVHLRSRGPNPCWSPV